jgi:hypothetical protein
VNRQLVLVHNGTFLGLVYIISPGVSALHRRRLLGLSIHGTCRGQRRKVHLVGCSGHGGAPPVQAIVTIVTTITGRSRAIAGASSRSTL